jgi:hypothetical protein
LPETGWMWIDETKSNVQGPKSKVRVSVADVGHWTLDIGLWTVGLNGYS